MRFDHENLSYVLAAIGVGLISWFPETIWAVLGGFVIVAAMEVMYRVGLRHGRERAGTLL